MSFPAISSKALPPTKTSRTCGKMPTQVFHVISWQGQSGRAASGLAARGKSHVLKGHDFSLKTIL
jgi:hypothetical protein